MITELSILLLSSTLAVRWLAGSKSAHAWRLDLATVPLWLLFYWQAGAWGLLPLPFVLGAISYRNLRLWR